MLERLEGAPAPPPGPAASGVQVTPGRAMAGAAAGGAAGAAGLGAHKRKEGDSAVSESMPTANKRARAAAGLEQSPPGEGGAAAGASAAGGGSLQEMIALRQNNLVGGPVCGLEGSWEGGGGGPAGAARSCWVARA